MITKTNIPTGLWARGTPISNQKQPLKGLKKISKVPREYKKISAKIIKYDPTNESDIRIFNYKPRDIDTEIVFFLVNNQDIDNPFLFYGLDGDPSRYNFALLLGKYEDLTDSELPEFMELFTNTFTSRESIIIVRKAIKDKEFDNIQMRRISGISRDPHYISNEPNYIHNMDPSAFEFVKENLTSDLQSFHFVSIHDIKLKELESKSFIDDTELEFQAKAIKHKERIQHIINSTYPTEYLYENKDGLKVLSKYILAYKQMFKTHVIDTKGAKKIVNETSQLAASILDKLDAYNIKRIQDDKLPPIDFIIPRDMYNIESLSNQDIIRSLLEQVKNQTYDTLGNHLFIQPRNPKTSRQLTNL